MEQSSNVVTVEIPADDPRKRANLRGLINAQFGAERWQRRLQACGRLIVILSIPMAYLLHLGLSPSANSVRFVLAVWLLLLLLSFICAEAVARARRRVEQLMSRSGARRIGSID